MCLWRNVGKNVADYERSSLNYFTARGVDRASDKRRDEMWLAARLEDESTRFIPVWRSRNLVTVGQVPRPVFLSPHDGQDLIRTAESTILLGVSEDRTYFAIDVPAEEDSPSAALAALGQSANWRDDDCPGHPSKSTSGFPSLAAASGTEAALAVPTRLLPFAPLVRSSRLRCVHWSASISQWHEAVQLARVGWSARDQRTHLVRPPFAGHLPDSSTNPLCCP